MNDNKGCLNWIAFETKQKKLRQKMELVSQSEWLCQVSVETMDFC